LWIWGLCCLGAVAARGVEATGADLKSDNPVHSTLDRAVDTEAVGYFHSGCHVGLSLAIVDSDGTHYYDYGATTRSGAKLADRRSIYEIASVTKVFTAALAAKAVVNHRMVLDGDFRSYLPGSYPNLASNGHPITLRWLRWCCFRAGRKAMCCLPMMPAKVPRARYVSLRWRSTTRSDPTIRSDNRW
jgi:serine-type D-Ala-D-Ala carboxypeptidase/endopeptidase